MQHAEALFALLIEQRDPPVLHRRDAKDEQRLGSARGRARAQSIHDEIHKSRQA